MADNPLYPPLDPSWKKIESGLKWMVMGVLVPIVILPFLVIFSVFEEGKVGAVFSLLVLAAVPISLSIGLIKCFAISDSLSKGFLAGSFLSVILGVAGIILENQFTQVIPSLIFLPINAFIVLLLHAGICFFILFLLRIALFFQDGDLAEGCRYIFIIFTCLFLLLTGEEAVRDAHNRGLVTWDFLVIPSLKEFLIGIFIVGEVISFYWFLALITQAGATIQQALARTAKEPTTEQAGP